MNTNLRRTGTTLFLSGVLAAVVLVGLGTGSTPALGAPGDTASPSAPLVWTNPQNVTNSGYYDQTPWIGVARNTGAVTIGYEERAAPPPDFTEIRQVSNTALGGPFRSPQVLEESEYAYHDRNVRASQDSLGRRWMAWYGPDGGNVCGWIARIELDGSASIVEPINGTCLGSGEARKNVALSVGPDDTVHALFGRNDENIFYYRGDVNGNFAPGENVPGAGNPGNIAVEAVADGSVLVGYTATGSGHSKDIYVSVRSPNGAWQTRQNISAVINPGDGRISAHLPALRRDNAGGVRAIWGQTKVDPWTDPGNDDVFYREWTPAGGWSGTIYRFTNNTGQSYDPDLVVDANNVAHIFWGDDTGRTRGTFQLFYGTFANGVFTSYGAIFAPQFGSNYQKEPSTGYGGGAVHVTFGSTRVSVQGDPKENWYAYNILGPTPTNTPAITNTPTHTPTPCPPGYFLDVVPTDYFYVPVTDLAGRGIMAGYNDCRFRPYNNLTRGQAAKIVVLGAELPIQTPNTPTFSDVPTSNPFFQYIESAYDAGVITGYSDGTFRPNNNVTRGQFAKMTILAFELATYTPPTPTFTDVPANHPFFQYIEGAYRLDLISGYADRTFRPGNEIVRGQAAKIVYNARGLASSTPTSTAVVVTATVTDTPFVVTATPTSTPLVVTSTPTETPNVVTATPTSTATP